MRFRVRALKPGGGVASMTVDAADGEEAQRRVSAEGMGVLSVERASGLAGRAREPAFPLTQFASELRSLLEAGVSLLEAIQTLAEKEPKPAVREVLAHVVAALGEGRTLSTALEGRGAAFGALFVATVRASERTGGLPEALGRFVAYRNQQELVRARLVNASIYPVLLLGVGTLVILFLLIYVVPRFSRVYADIGGDLPLMSRWLLEAGTLMEGHLAAMLGGTAVVAAALVALVRTGPARAWLGALPWRIGFIGERLMVYQLARFFRTTGMLVRGGVPVVSALEMSQGLLQAHLRPALASAVARVREGRSLSGALDAHGLSTPVIARMLRVGEKTGELGNMMERIAVFHDAETERAAEWLTRLFSPVLMLAMGVVIGGVVVLMYLPIFQLAEQVK
jgi:general secretion pathway protein F